MNARWQSSRNSQTSWWESTERSTTEASPDAASFAERIENHSSPVARKRVQIASANVRRIVHVPGSMFIHASKTFSFFPIFVAYLDSDFRGRYRARILIRNERLFKGATCRRDSIRSIDSISETIRSGLLYEKTSFTVFTKAREASAPVVPAKDRRPWPRDDVSRPANLFALSFASKFLAQPPR